MAARLSDRERGQGDAGHVGDTLVTLMPRLVTRSANYLKLLADETVNGEPVCEENSLLAGKMQGIFRDLRRN